MQQRTRSPPTSGRVHTGTPAPASATKNPYSHRMFYSAFLCVFSVLGSYYNEIPDLLFLTTCVMCTSFLYWHDPVDGWRRKLDMVVAQGTVAYEVVHSGGFLPSGMARAAHAASVAIAVCWYLGARHYGRTKGDFDSSSRCHVMMHVVGTISNMFLYDALGKNHMGW